MVCEVFWRTVDKKGRDGRERRRKEGGERVLQGRFSQERAEGRQGRALDREGGKRERK